MSDMERRFLATAESRIGFEADSKHIRGYAAVFNVESNPLPGPQGKTFREVILPGAFDDVLASESLDVIANYQHDDSSILGRSSSGTLTLSVDERGLAIDIDPPDTTLGRDIRKLIERGDLGANGAGCSFAFSVAEGGDQWSEDYSTRTIRKVSGLYDVAICTTPAYPETSVAVRSLERYLADSTEAVLEEELPELDLEAYRLFLARITQRRARDVARYVR